MSEESALGPAPDRHLADPAAVDIAGIVEAHSFSVAISARSAGRRVSTTEQTTANQERELREVASRMGCEVVKVYRDHGISAAKGRDERPQFDRLCRGATKREFDAIMTWSADR